MKRFTILVLLVVATLGRAEELLRSVPSSWAPFEAGFVPDTTVHRAGASSAKCVATTNGQRLGAQLTISLDQSVPTPIVVSGWSKALAVGGSTDRDYAIYIDARYDDGTPLWGVVAPFTVGTHDWQRRKVLVQPKKPLKSLTVYALFRNHEGTVWFDSFSAQELKGSGIFDGQPLNLRKPQASKSVVSAGDLRFGPQGQIANGGGFFIRQFGSDEVVPVASKVVQGKDGVDLSASGFHATVHLSPNASRPGPLPLQIDGELSGDQGPVTLYFAVPLDGSGKKWGDDIRHDRTIAPNGEYANLTTTAVGATGAISLYPFACVSSPAGGLMLSNGMEWPTVDRIFYNEANRLLAIGWDFAVSKDRPALFRCRLERLTPQEAKWGFRAAAARFYAANSARFERRATRDGIWMPFTDPSKIEKPKDFGIMFHEGDNSIATDRALGIQSYRYVEPMSYWMPMAPSEPRAYDNAIRILNDLAKAGNREAMATLNCATKDADGRLNLQFRNEPWCNGAVFVLNPNPDLPGQPTKARLNYDPIEAEKQYALGMNGQYLDSLEAWSDTNDYAPSHLAACRYPLTFDPDGKPVLPQWFSTYAYASWLSDVLHRKNKLLFANSTPVQYSIFAGVLDIMGIEVNWLDGDGRWQPNDDETFDMRRTLSYRRPYLLLQNTNFDRFSHDMVRRYFERSMFYAVFPSMFSADAATNPYWENPKLYNRDRDLFLRYIPLIKRLSAAGWEPVTGATARNLWVERYGAGLLTVFNAAAAPVRDALTLEQPLKAKTVTDLLTGERFNLKSIPVAPEQCRVLRLNP